MNRGGECTGDDERNERPRLEFEQQKFDSQNHARDRGIESGGHPRRCSTGEQDLTFGSRSMKNLTDQRTHGAASLNNGALGAERPTGADGNCRRNGL